VLCRSGGIEVKAAAGGGSPPVGIASADPLGVRAPGPAGAADPFHRSEWLRDRLADLAAELGRAPDAAELSIFLRRHRVRPAEVDALTGDLQGARPASRPGRDATRGASGSVLRVDRPTTAVASPHPAARVPVPAPRPSATPASLPAAGHHVARAPGHTEATVPVSSSGDGTVVRRAVDDLVDDWHRAGRSLQYEDVTRLSGKRGLTAEQTALVLDQLAENGVTVEGLTTVGLVADVAAVDDTAAIEVSESDIVRSYLRRIARYPLLRAADEVRLGRKIQAGLRAGELVSDPTRAARMSASQLAALGNARAAGRKAHADMVQANLRLVVSIAKKRGYEGRGVEFMDRIQDGNSGLMHAADKFDPERGFKFSTYATWWIRQAVERGLADRGRAIRVPVHVHEKLGQLGRARRELEARLGRRPTVDELADDLAWAPGTVQAMVDHLLPVVSLELPVGTAGDSTLGDLLADQADVDGRTDPVECVVDSARVRDLEWALSDLDERSAVIIRRRYGLYDGERDSLDEIGRRFGVTRERIRQLESKALERLRAPAISDRLRIYLLDDGDERGGSGGGFGGPRTTSTEQDPSDRRESAPEPNQETVIET
jgi:RNA polymerase primary sigma factor